VNGLSIFLTTILTLLSTALLLDRLVDLGWWYVAVALGVLLVGTVSVWRQILRVEYGDRR
jgi:O-antigen/teichoic acid export membrane protein